MRSRIHIHGRNAHQPGNGKAVRFPASLDEFLRILRGNAGFLRFHAGIHLNETFGMPVLLLHFRCEQFCDAVAIDGFDDIEKRDSLACLVALQRPDEMQANIRI